MRRLRLRGIRVRVCACVRACVRVCVRVRVRVSPAWAKIALSSWADR